MAVSGGKPGRWWPVDTLFLVYLGGLGALVAANFTRVPAAGWLLAAHAAGLALIFLAVRWRNPVLHYWYPLCYIPLCYKEMALLIPPLRGLDFDAAMARADRRLWGLDPIVWLERLLHPWLTEYLQIVYTLFIPCVVLVAVLLWIRPAVAPASAPGGSPAAVRKPRPARQAFRYYAFVVSLGFLASYIGYFLVPVRGPRFFLVHPAPLEGVWLFDSLQRVLDRLEAAHYDCFPSGHTEMTLIACWFSRFVSPRVFAGFCLYTASIVFATVYLRYHYTVDVIAGALLAVVVLLVAPRLEAAGRSRREENTG